MQSRIPVLEPSQAGAAVLTGLFLLFFGFFAYRATIVVYLAIIGALVAQVIGVRVFETSSPWLWILGGALAGAIVAVPVEVFLRVLLGIATGAGLGLAVGVASAEWEGGLIGLAAGALVGGILWLWLGEVFIMSTFALLGAADALVGILSFLQRDQQTLTIPNYAFALVVFSAFLGTTFQYLLNRPAEPAPAEREGVSSDGPELDT